MRIYYHQPDTNPTVIDDVADTATVASLIAITEGEFVFLDDDGEPIDVEVAIVEVLRPRGREPGHHHHVYRHPCRIITVTITYGGATRSFPVAPPTTIAAVTTEAVAAFGIDPVSGADLVLRLPGSDTDLPDSTPISSLTHDRACAVELNLLPAHREAG